MDMRSEQINTEAAQTASELLVSGNFISPTEDYGQLLENDRQSVESLHLTNAQLAEPLAYIQRNTKPYANDQRVTIGNKQFLVEVIHYRGKKMSPFSPSVWTDKNYSVTDVETNDVLLFSGLAPEHIAKYGFFGGMNSAYRLSPERIAAFFAL